jgi:predicted nucleic acid-binding protein
MKNPKSAEEIMGILLDCEFKEWGMTEEICKLIFGLMNTLQVTFYDASYHALAIQHKAKFITSDKEYFRKTKDKSNIILYE